MLIIIKNSYTFFLYSLLFSIFIVNMIEDIFHKEIYIHLTGTEIIILIMINTSYFKLIFIYIFFIFLYFIFFKFLKNHMGFGDIWYLLFYFYNLPTNFLDKIFILYICLLINLFIYIIIQKNIPKTIGFLPVIGGAFIINLFFIYKIKVF